MNTTLLFAGLLLIIIVLVVVYNLLDRRLDKPSRDYYVDGLDAMVRKDFRQAAHAFRRAVEADSDNVLAYEKLGHVYRELGDLQRAAKIHRELTVRGGISPEDRARILLSLSDDLIRMGREDEARQAAEKAALEDKRNINSFITLLGLHERAGRWEDALAALKKAESLGGQPLKERRARITVELARAQIAAGKGRQGRVMLKDALKEDPCCVPAMVLMGDSYKDEGRDEEAIRYWERVPFEVPASAWQVFDRIESLYFEKGRFGDVEALYQRVIHSNPENPDAWVALAQFHERKGELEQAISMCHEGLQKTGESIDVARMLIRLLGRKGDSRELISFTSRLVDRLMEDDRRERERRVRTTALEEDLEEGA